MSGEIGQTTEVSASAFKLTKRQTQLGLAMLLAVAVCAVYAPVLNHTFLLYDDRPIISENENIRQGLSVDSVKWAFTTGEFSNWYPITRLSHMLTFTLFGHDAGLHHAVNVVLHLANTLLLFCLLTRLTGTVGRSLLVAALFALHPLHVESVVWLEERKDVLSTLFWLLTTYAYLGYVETRGSRRYLMVMALFCIGLMAKPMLVTLPCTLLLLDAWPLSRMNSWDSAKRLFIEKIPLFIIALASTASALYFQSVGGAVKSLDYFPLHVRVGNAIVSYCAYLGKMIWPSGLAIHYPHYIDVLPVGLVVLQISAAGLSIAALTLYSLYVRKNRPYVLFGWLWYLGTLVPVIGFVQIGVQRMADRYTYIPLIGIFIAIAWFLGDMAAGQPRRARVIGASCAAAVFALAVVTAQQVRYWKDDATLFAHALEVTRPNAIVHTFLARGLMEKGELEASIPHFEAAQRLHPNSAPEHNDLGAALAGMGRYKEASDQFMAAANIEPENVSYVLNFAKALADMGDLESALTVCQSALMIKPENLEAQSLLEQLGETSSKTP